MTERRPLPEHVTMPLLQRIVDQSVDQDYAEAARRRPDREPRRPAALGTVLAVVALFGLLVATAFVQNVRTSEVAETSRSVLLARVAESREAGSRQQERVAELQADVVTAEQEAADLQRRLTALERNVRRRGALAGTVPVTGPGIRVTVDDSATGLPDGVVRDEDLALLVDALWGVGAEAVAINGKRLTVQSSIRNSNVAINVNSRPLSPPYRVEAIGDVDTMQARLLESGRGNQWFGLADQLAFDYQLENVDTLRLPAARTSRLLFAVAGLDDPALKEEPQ